MKIEPICSECGEAVYGISVTTQEAGHVTQWREVDGELEMDDYKIEYYKPSELEYHYCTHCDTTYTRDELEELETRPA